jgi:hypothetical protein
MHRLSLSVLLLSIISPAFALAQTAPPEPEQYIPDGRYPQYARAVEDYLRATPDAPAAPRIAMDLLVTATVRDDQIAALKMAKLILSQYPTSPQAKYVVAEMTDANQFVGLMSDIADDGFETMTPDFAIRYDNALRLGVARFGAPALGEGAGLTRESIIARESRDLDMQKVLVEELNQTGEAGAQWRAVLIDVADESKPLLDRIKELHTISDRATAIPFERFLLNQLPAADQKTDDALKIQADDMLETGKLIEAQPLLAKLSSGPAGNDPRLLFWSALAANATGDSATAQKCFSQLRQGPASDPWVKEGAELEPAISGLTTTLDRNVEAALSASRRFAAGTDLLEGNATYTRTDGQKIDLYLGISNGKLLELLEKEGKGVALGYRATDQDGSLYFKGEKSVLHFPKPALLPVPLFAIGRSGNDFVFRMNVKFSVSFDDLQTAMKNLLATDFLSTREGLQDFLRNFTQRGIIPLPPQSGPNGTTIYTWVNPEVSSPKESRVSFTVGSDGAVAAAQAGDFTVTNLRYGPAGTFALNAPAFPAFPPVEEQGPMNMQVLQFALSAFISELRPPPPAPATQPAAASSASTAPLAPGK